MQPKAAQLASLHFLKEREKLTRCDKALDGHTTDHNLNAYKLLHLQQMVTLVDLQDVLRESRVVQYSGHNRILRFPSSRSNPSNIRLGTHAVVLNAYQINGC